MAFIWTDKRHNDENMGLASAPKFKQVSSVRKQFGELKNVIHNQGAATPFRGDGKKSTYNQGARTPFNGAGKNVFHNQGAPTPFKGVATTKWLGAENLHPTGFDPTKSLCADVLRKQQMKQNFADTQKLLEKKLNPSTTVRPVGGQIANTVETSIYEDFDDFDLPVNTCTGECTKSLEQIWAAMNVFDEDFFNIKSPKSDTEDEDKDQFKWSDDDDLFFVEEKDYPESMPWNMLHELKMPTLPNCEFDIPLLEETEL